MCADEKCVDSFDKTFPASPENAPVLRHELRTYIAHHELSDDQAFNILLATGEAFINAIEHAYSDERGEIRVVVCKKTDVIDIKVEDYGKWELKGEFVDELSTRGRGLIIMYALMDEVELNQQNTGTTVKFKLNLDKALAQKVQV